MSVHFSLPFRFEGTSAVTVEQDSLDDVAQSVQIIVTTPLGYRAEVPDFGTDPILFEQSSSPVAHQILASVTEWEPRAVVDVTSNIDSLDDFIRNIRAKVTTQ